MFWIDGKCQNGEERWDKMNLKPPPRRRMDANNFEKPHDETVIQNTGLLVTITNIMRLSCKTNN